MGPKCTWVCVCVCGSGSHYLASPPLLPPQERSRGPHMAQKVFLSVCALLFSTFLFFCFFSSTSFFMSFALVSFCKEQLAASNHIHNFCWQFLCGHLCFTGPTAVTESRLRPSPQSLSAPRPNLESPVGCSFNHLLGGPDAGNSMQEVIESGDGKDLPCSISPMNSISSLGPWKFSSGNTPITHTHTCAQCFLTFLKQIKISE